MSYQKMSNEQILHARVVELEAENKRLRDALEKINVLGATMPDPTAEIDIARQALKGGQG